LRSLVSFPTRRSSDLAINTATTSVAPSAVLDTEKPEAIPIYIPQRCMDSIRTALMAFAPQRLRRGNKKYFTIYTQSEHNIFLKRSEEHTSELQSRENL